MSGGRATLAARKGVKLSAQAGDVSTVSAAGAALTDRFIVECKFYKNLRLDTLVFDNAGQLMKFWLEVRNEAVRYGKLPMLIAKQNNKRTIMCLNENGLVALNQLKLLAIVPRVGLYVCSYEDALNVPPLLTFDVSKMRVRLSDRRVP